MQGGNSAGAALRAVSCIAVLSALAACAGPTATTAVRTQSANRFAGPAAGRYHVRNDHPPGPPGDPWGPYIKEASSRFGMPENWVRQVMRVESGGQQTQNGAPTTSPVGAMGLMQVMPGTYGDLKLRYNLGDDPYDPHDNIMAGTGYLRELYDRFGSPNFLAAYNAGPRRVDDYVAGNGRLPTETVNYVAMIAPRLGGGTVTDGDGNSDPNILYAAQTGINGPIVQVASAAPPTPPYSPPPDLAPLIAASAGAPAYHVQPAGAQPEEASDDAAPAPTPPAPAYQVQPAVPAPAPPVYAVQQAALPPAAAPDRAPAPVYQVQQAALPASVGGPGGRSGGGSGGSARLGSLVEAAERQPGLSAPSGRSEPRMVLIQSPRPSAGNYAPSSRTQLASAEAPPPRGGASNWAVQVGAYSTSAQANAAALSARSAAGPLLRNSNPSVGIATRPDGTVLFRARLAGVTADTAEKACGVLSSHQIACASVPPT